MKQPGYIKRIDFASDVRARMYVSAMRHKGWDLTDPKPERDISKKIVWVVLILKRPLFE